MPERHEVVMQMVAELDQGTFDSDVARMMEGVVGAIERAFAGIGDKLAQEMLRGLDSVRGQMGGGTSVGMIGGPSPFFSGGPEGLLQAPAVPAPPPGSEPFTTIQNNTNTSAPYLAATRGGYIDPFTSPGQALSTFAPGAAAPGLDAELAMVRARQMAIGAGIADPFSEFDIDQIMQIRGGYGEAMESGLAAQQSKQRQVGLRTRRIESLESELGRLEAQGAGGGEYAIKVEQQIEKYGQENERLREEIKGLAETMRGASRAMDELGKIADRQQGMATGQLIGQGAMVLGAGMTFASQVPRALRAGQVGAAQVQNLESRALFDEDYSRALAISQLGGQEAITQGAMGEAGLSIGGRIIGGLGTAIGTGGLMGMAGLGLAGSGAMDLMQFNAAVAQRAEERIGAELNRNREVYQALPLATQFSTQAFRGAQGLGVTGQAEFFTAGAGQYRDQLAAQEEIQRIQTELAATAGTVDEQIGTSGRTIGVANPRIAQLQERLRTVQQAAQESGGGLTQFGVQRAMMSPEMVQQTLMQTAAGMGGFFQGGPAGGLLGQMTPEMQNIMMMQAHGLGAAPELAGAFFRGGTMDVDQLVLRQGAVGDLQTAYEAARNAGLDLTSVNAQMGRMGGQAAAIGLGGRETAMRRQGLALQRAGQMFGEGAPISGFQMEAIENVQMQAEAMTAVGGGGLAEIAGLSHAGRVLEQHNIKTNYLKEMIVARFAPTADSKALARELGISEDKAKDIINAFTGGQAKAVRDTVAQSLGYTSEEAAVEGSEASMAVTLAIGGTTGRGLAETQTFKDIAAGRRLPGAKDVGAGVITDEAGRAVGTRAPFAVGEAVEGGQPQELVAANVRVAATKLSGGMENLGEQISVVTKGLFNLHQRIQTLVQQIGGNPVSGGMSVGTAVPPTEGTQGAGRGALKSDISSALNAMGIKPREKMAGAPEG